MPRQLVTHQTCEQKVQKPFHISVIDLCLLQEKDIKLQLSEESDGI